MWTRSRPLVAPMLVAAAALVAAQLTGSPTASAQTHDGPDHLSVVWPARARVVARSQPLTATLRVPASGLVRTVVLERHTPGRWNRVHRSLLPAGETRAVLEVPVSYYGTFDYRVRVLAQDGSVEDAGRRRLRVVPAYRPEGNPMQHRRLYAHSLHANPYLRWNPCGGPIRWTVNVARMADRRAALHDLREAVARLHVATGLGFRFVGTTTQDPRGALLVHGLGHALALGHVGDRDEIMHAVINQHSTHHSQLGAGDLAGLETVGAQQGCHYPATKPGNPG